MGNYIVYDPPTTNDLGAYVTDNVLAAILSDIPTEAARIQTVNDAIDAAESLIDSYLCQQYEVPVDSPPRLILDIAAALIAEALYQRGVGVPEAIAERAAAKMRILRDLANGVSALDGATPLETSETAGYFVSDSETRWMNRDNLTFH